MEIAMAILRQPGAVVTAQRESDILTRPEVSQLWHIPDDTLRYWRTKGIGPPSFKVGRRVLYRHSGVEAWFAEQEAATRRGGNAA